MRLRFLGTGTSYGVPYVGCSCAVCTSTDPRDKRLRASILVEHDDVRLLVDTGPDFRTQMLRAGMTQLSAVLWTHLHNDHVIGLDDVRPLTDRNGYLSGYGDAPTLAHIEHVFGYALVQNRDHGGFPRVSPHVIEPGQKLQFGAIRVTPLRILHGTRSILAYEFARGERRIVYATDCSHIPDESYETMRGADVFIVDALRHTAHPNHFNIEQALEAVEKIGPKQAFFTHITHDLGHAETEAMLPQGVKLAHDNLELDI